MRQLTIIAAMLASVPAWAQSPPTPVADPRQLTGGSLEEGEVDRFSFQLKEMKDYALEVLTGDDCSTWTVRAPGGAVVRSELLGCDDESWGFEFRTGKAGTYTLEGRNDSWGEDGGYQWRIVTDCRADAKTQCSIRPGRTQGHGLAYGLELDWIKLAGLRTGRRYTLEIVEGRFAGLLGVFNGRGQIKVAPSSEGKVTFRAPSAIWYAVVESLDDSQSGHTYRLSLRAE